MDESRIFAALGADYDYMPQEVADAIDKVKVFDTEGRELGNPPWFKDGTPNYLNVGEEADRAECEDCHTSRDITEGVCCELCGGFFCRRRCWPEHWCDRGKITDYNGRVVKVGDRLMYVDKNNTVYKVVEMLHSFAVGGICHAERKDGVRLPIRPRLMYILEEGS